MTELAIAVDADDELWTLDDLPTPAAPYVEVESELIEVRSRFPSSYYTLTGETLPPRIRVRRGIAGTTKASHIQGSTLTPNYGLGGSAGAGGVTVDNQVDAPAEVATIIAAGADLSTPGEATMRGKDFYAQDTDPGAVGAGSVWKDTTSGFMGQWWTRNDENDGWIAKVQVATFATGDDDADAVVSANSVDGTAYGATYAEATGIGNANGFSEARSVTGAAFSGSLATRDGVSAGMYAEVDGVSARLAFNGTTPIAIPEIPASPTEQDIADVLVALGLATQAV